MEITIKGTAKEIAALVLSVQERQNDLDVNLDNLPSAFDKAFSDVVMNHCRP